MQKYQARVFDLEFQVKELQRLLFGAKRERFESETPASQIALPFETDAEQVTAAVEAELERITYDRKKAEKRQHPGRMEMPTHLPVQETIIEPAHDTTDMVRIGQEVSDVLEMTPARMFVKRTRVGFDQSMQARKTKTDHRRSS